MHFEAKEVRKTQGESLRMCSVSEARFRVLEWTLKRRSLNDTGRIAKYVHSVCSGFSFRVDAPPPPVPPQRSVPSPSPLAEQDSVGDKNFAVPLPRVLHFFGGASWHGPPGVPPVSFRFPRCPPRSVPKYLGDVSLTLAGDPMTLPPVTSLKVRFCDVVLSWLSVSLR